MVIRLLTGMALFNSAKENESDCQLTEPNRTNRTATFGLVLDFTSKFYK